MVSSEPFDPTTFFEIVDDPDIFYYRGYNLFKVFYFRFWKRINLIPGYKTSSQRNLKWVLGRLFAFVKPLIFIIRISFFKRKSAPRVLFYNSSGGRHIDINGTTYDLYNPRIVDAKKRERFIIIEDYDTGISKQYSPDFYLHDFAVFTGLLYGLSRLILARDLQQYVRKVVNRYPALGFSEVEAIDIVLLYYGKLFTYRFLLGLLAPERVLMRGHFGGEAFIAVCKQQKIPVIELQHGVIVPGHSYYRFPQSYSHLFSQALFPDKLAVYGEYWKNNTVQDNIYPEESVVVVGYYLKMPDSAENLVPHDKIIIMIATQPETQPIFLDYISFLSANLNRESHYIIIKPHPLENPKVYDQLLQPGFITLTHQSPYQLLPQVDVHISACSTLLYEAARYDVSNYVLLIDNVPAHCKETANSGVALPLKPDQLPEPGKKPDIDPKFYFADFNPSVLFEP